MITQVKVRTRAAGMGSSRDVLCNRAGSKGPLEELVLELKADTWEGASLGKARKCCFGTREDKSRATDGERASLSCCSSHYRGLQGTASEGGWQSDISFPEVYPSLQGYFPCFWAHFPSVLVHFHCSGKKLIPLSLTMKLGRCWRKHL